MSENYITEWEKEMKASIDAEVEEEINRINANNNQPRPRVIYLQGKVAQDWYRGKRTKELEEEYRKKHILNILEQSGLDMEALKDTWMYSCGRFNYVLECIQNIIDGFGFNKDGDRVLKRRPMDLSKAIFELSAGHIIIKTPRSTYDISVDEHQVIYVNGKDVLKLRPMKTPQEEREEAQDFMESMRADRLAHERRMQRSMIAARDTWTGQV